MESEHSPFWLLPVYQDMTERDPAILEECEAKLTDALDSLFVVAGRCGARQATGMMQA